jgi:hypothetical protein
LYVHKVHANTIILEARVCMLRIAYMLGLNAFLCSSKAEIAYKEKLSTKCLCCLFLRTITLCSFNCRTCFCWKSNITTENGWSYSPKLRLQSACVFSIYDRAYGITKYTIRKGAIFWSTMTYFRFHIYFEIVHDFCLWRTWEWQYIRTGRHICVPCIQTYIQI